MSSTSNQPNRSTDDITDTTPLLSQSEPNLSPGRQTLRDAARLLRRASSRRMMREPSMLVRETAAEQLEERQSDWAYSKPVVILDLIWNFAFVAAAAAVLVLSREEETSVPLRLWIVGYAAQCVLHMACVIAEYRRRQGRRRGRRTVEYAESGSGPAAAAGGGGDGNSGPGSGGSSVEYVSLAELERDNTSSVAKHLESANTMFSFIWWIIGFYWVSAGGQALAVAAPMLYWASVAYLGFDVLFVVFCVALACVIGIAVCCCLPCIIAILYAVADQEGASKEDIDQLSKFKFRKVSDNEKADAGTQGPSAGIMTECGTDSPIEHFISQEDAECCICLSSYDDGVELRELPCRHHFHCACVDKWLCINASCPLCKYNILKGGNQEREEA